MAAILIYRCPHCLADRITFTSLAIAKRSSNLLTALFECPNCRKPSGAWFKRERTVNNTNPEQLQANWKNTFEEAGWDLMEFWPKETPSEAPASLPAAIERNFIQATEAARRGHREAAGMTYRRALELALKDKAPEIGGNLKQRIKKMGVNGQLTPDVATWADSIRDLGNEATHDEEEPSEEDTEDLASFTRVVLEYIYTMPMKVRRRRDPDLGNVTPE